MNLLRARSEVKFGCHVRGFARVARLATALRTYATRTPNGYEKVTISLYARVVITLVSSTLRDTSFLYNILRSTLNNSNRSPRFVAY